MRYSIGAVISPISRNTEMSLLSAPAEGIRLGMAQAVTAANQISNGEVSPDNVVRLMEANVMVKANAAVLRTGSETVGTLLDTLA